MKLTNQMEKIGRELEESMLNIENKINAIIPEEKTNTLSDFVGMLDTTELEINIMRAFMEIEK